MPGRNCFSACLKGWLFKADLYRVHSVYNPEEGEHLWLNCCKAGIAFSSFASSQPTHIFSYLLSTVIAIKNITLQSHALPPNLSLAPCSAASKRIWQLHPPLFIGGASITTNSSAYLLFLFYLALVCLIQTQVTGLLLICLQYSPVQ